MCEIHRICVKYTDFTFKVHICAKYTIQYLEFSCVSHIFGDLFLLAVQTGREESCVSSQMAVLGRLQTDNRGGSPCRVCAYDSENFIKVFHQNVDVLQRRCDQQSRTVQCVPSPLSSCLSVDESLIRRRSAFVMFRSATVVCRYTAHYQPRLSYYGTLVCSCKRTVKTFPFLVAPV